MPDNSPNDVFRFVQIRPPLPAEERMVAELLDTQTAQTLRSARTVQDRVEQANGFLRSGDSVRSLPDAYAGTDIRNILESLTDPKATTTDLLNQLANIPPDDRLQIGRTRLSNTLLAVLFATAYHPADLDALQDVYRVYDLLDRASKGTAHEVPLAVFRRRPIQTPFRLEPLPPAAQPFTVEAVRDDVRTTTSLSAAVRELVALDRARYTNPPGGGERVAFALREEHAGKLSDDTRRLLAERDLDPTNLALFSVVGELENEWRETMSGAVTVPPPPPAGKTKLPIPGPFRPAVRPSGVADLLVVKQHLKRYDALDIAHIENVLAGEKKSRSHRRLERSEETFTRETETTTEKEKELQTADRFELNREASKTVRDSINIGVDLSVSGKYGPSVEFSSNFHLDSTHATEETAKSASTFAHDVVERSLERITERVREEIVRKLVLETEETNLHELNNPGGTGAEHVRGVYQFLEKVYEAQIFNYGIRQLFDFMVPEPASFVWWMQQRPDSSVKIPEPPPALTLADALSVTVDNYRTFAARYGALDVEQPPPEYKRLVIGKKHGVDDASEKDQPHSSDRTDVQLPSGYVPWKAVVRVSCFTDEHPVLSVTILDQTQIWRPNNSEGLSDGHTLHTEPRLEFDFSTVFTPVAGDKIGIETMMWESNSYALEIQLICWRTNEELVRWKLATYKKIRDAYDDRVKEHEQKVRALQAEAESVAARETRTFGRSPSENYRTVLTELKKHCLSILTQQWFDTFDATNEGTQNRPPTFDLNEAESEGSFIRFFEQAFEWEQMQWVFYPYFWARVDTWPDRFARQDVDPLFRDFLQAGSARVVVPVRPGFEVAVTHFVETGTIWNGAGTPPAIHSPLYISIIDEIKDRTQAGKGEIPVATPWDVHLPTPLVYVREKDDLPVWRRVGGKDWEWEPVP